MRKYIGLFFIFALCCLPFMADDLALKIDSQKMLLSPSWEFWGGSDSLGRDVLLRSLLGAGISLLICFVAMGLTYFLGVFIGSVLSYWQRPNHLVIFLIDMFDSIPNFLLVALFSILLNRGIGTNESTPRAFMILVISIAIAAWAPIARNIRLEILQLKGKDFLNAAIISGAGPFHIIGTHYRRALWPWLRISIAHNIPQFLLIESVLSFTGFGMSSHNATLGYLIYEGWKNALMFPHVFVVPSFILYALVFILTRVVQKP